MLEQLASGFAVLSAFISFIFVFFIGTDVAFSGTSGSLPVTLEASGIYDYFGSVYKDIEILLESAAAYPSYYPASLYVTAAFGTVTAALTLLASLVLFALALTRYLLRLTGRTQKSAGALSAAAYFCFLAGALLFLSLERMSISASYTHSGTTERAEGAVVLNSATVAGIIIGAVFLALYAVCAAACDRREKGMREAVLRYAFAAAKLALCLVCLCLLAGGCIGGGAHEVTSSDSSSLSFTLGFAGVYQFIAAISAGDISTLPLEMDANFNTVAAMCIAGFVAQLVLTAVVIELLAGLTASTEGRRRTFLLCIAAGILSIAAAVFAAIAADSGILIVNELADLPLRTNLARIIVVIVFSVLLIAAAVAALLTENILASPAQPRTAPYAPYAPYASGAVPAPVPYAPQPAPMPAAQQTAPAPQEPPAPERE